jgi:hypothetical protein
LQIEKTIIFDRTLVDNSVSSEEIRSIGCGPVGAFISALIASLIFNWQVRHWSHRIPSKFHDKEKDQLLKEYKNTNRIAKVFGLAGIRHRVGFGVLFASCLCCGG